MVCTAVRMVSSPVRRRGRPPGMTLSRMRKRYAIATGIILGIKIADVARQLGVSRSWASREAHSPGVQNIIAALIEENREQFERVLNKALNAMNETMDARNEYFWKGQILEGGPDHYTRLEAVKVVMKMLPVYHSSLSVKLTTERSCQQ